MRESRLEITHRIGVTKEVDDILTEQKKKQKKSKAEIVCNLVLEHFNNL